MDHEAINAAVRKRFAEKPLEVLLAVAAMAEKAIQAATEAVEFGYYHQHTYGGDSTLPAKMTKRPVSETPGTLDEQRAAFKLAVILGIESKAG